MTFGSAIKQARFDNNLTLEEVGNSIGVSASFISIIERDSAKIPKSFPDKVINYFAGLGYKFNDDMHELMAIANGTLSLKTLEPEHKKLVVKIAKANLTEEQINEISETYL